MNYNDLLKEKNELYLSIQDMDDKYTDEYIIACAKSEDLDIKLDLYYEMFHYDVAIEEAQFGLIAKWENKKHPENPNFMQPVFWAACEVKGSNTVSICYYLDKTNIQSHHVVARLPIEKSFKETVFNYWANN